jgi:hypothetical protein
MCRLVVAFSVAIPFPRDRQADDTMCQPDNVSHISSINIVREERGVSHAS